MPKLSLSNALRTKKKSLCASDAQLARDIGVSVPALRDVLSGKRDPNARTAGKYAKFLGIALPEKPKAAAKSGRRGPGRPKGSGKTAAGLPKSLKALAKDRLAVALHAAPKKLRKVVAVLLGVG